MLQAPLEFSNPIQGTDSVPNGRTVFAPQRGDFVLFPSYLPHTVPMRHAPSREQPRISIAFNIWFRGQALGRCVPMCCAIMHMRMLAVLCAHTSGV